MKTLERFLRYIRVGTSSSETAGTHPSTEGQFELAKILVTELLSMGIPKDDIFFDEEHCYVYALIRSNAGDDLPSTGFIAHMDTSPEASGENIRPQVIFDYDGGDITLSEGKILSPAMFPELLLYKGKTLVTTDGTTLLGSDDKSGIAEIMAMAEYLMTNKDIRHGDIRIAFTPDEEIGEGTMFFDTERFRSGPAYTVDGGRLGEISYENFNAASAVITVNGINVHPGEAYGKMINSQLVAMEIATRLPKDQRPDNTRDREGFFHLCSIEGDVSKTVMRYIIRDHDRSKFEEKKSLITAVCGEVEGIYEGVEIKADIKDTYYNMRDIMEPDNMFIVEKVIRAMEDLGITPVIEPVRGGTDGAVLSYRGLPCPNICAGGHNFHGVYEYVCVESMDKIADLLISVVEKG